jgi:hypothetical protein
MYVVTWPPYPPDFDRGSTTPTAPTDQWPTQQPPWDHSSAGTTLARPDYGVRADLARATAFVIALAVAGVLCGFLWHAVSARPHVIEGPGGSFQLPADTDKNYFGAEASFLAVTAGAGLLSGLVVWRLGRGRGPAVAVALALGSAAGGLVARAVGEAQPTNATLVAACGHDKGYDAICSVYNGHLHLRIAGLTLTWAIVSMAVFLALTMITDRAARRTATWPAPGRLPGWQPPPPPGYFAPPAPSTASVQPPEPWQSNSWPPA